MATLGFADRGDDAEGPEGAEASQSPKPARTSADGDAAVRSAPRYTIAPQVRLAPIEVPQQGSGSFAVAARIADDGQDLAGATTIRIEVEGGLRHQPDDVAERVMRTLRDPRGWSQALGVRFVQVSEDPELRILLATPRTTDELCAPLLTQGKVSCRNGDLVVLNAWRWEVGTTDYGDQVDRYRTYLINHEVGHALGESHRPCPGAGLPAPVMQQQTYGLQGCRINVWP